MFQKNTPLQTFKWDSSKFPFREIYLEHLSQSVDCPMLEQYHAHLPVERMPTDILEGTAHTYGHDILYAIDPAFRQAGFVPARERGFITLYRKFMRFIQDDIFGFPVVFQKLPSLRLHYPGFTSYGVLHTDREYNHPANEINIWVPITRTTKSASMIIESDIGVGDYKPVELDYGSLLVFNSALTHGNEVNNEGYTRMSFDMRVIPRDEFEDPAGTYSATANKEFKIGDYYDQFED